jgi:hypothetical protein
MVVRKYRADGYPFWGRRRGCLCRCVQRGLMSMIFRRCLCRAQLNVLGVINAWMSHIKVTFIEVMWIGYVHEECAWRHACLVFYGGHKLTTGDDEIFEHLLWIHWYRRGSWFTLFVEDIPKWMALDSATYTRSKRRDLRGQAVSSSADTCKAYSKHLSA